MARKKTTVYVDDDLWRLAKSEAAIQGRTLGDYLNELLEEETKGLKKRIRKGKKT